MTKVSDEIIIESYQRLRSVWKVAKEVGLCGQSVHERVKRLGVKTKYPPFTDKEKQVLVDEYIKYRNLGELQRLAEKLNRTKQFICRKAKELGLTDPTRLKPYAIKKDSDPYWRYHARVRSKRGSPKLCQVCGENDKRKWYDWANLTGNYDDPDDYMRMCRRCHREYDKKREKKGGDLDAERKQAGSSIW